MAQPRRKFLHHGMWGGGAAPDLVTKPQLEPEIPSPVFPLPRAELGHSLGTLSQSSREQSRHRSGYLTLCVKGGRWWCHPGLWNREDVGPPVEKWGARAGPHKAITPGALSVHSGLISRLSSSHALLKSNIKCFLIVL